MSYETLTATALQHFKLDETGLDYPSVPMPFAIDERISAGLTGCSGTDYPTRSGIGVDADSHKLIIDFTANRAASTQVLISQGYVKPFYLRLFGNGSLSLGYRDAGGAAIAGETLAIPEDGQRIKLSIDMKWSTGEIEVIDLSDTGYDDVLTDLSMENPPGVTGNFRIGAYAAAAVTPMTDAVVHSLEIQRSGSPPILYDFSRHPTRDLLGAVDLSTTGSPTYLAGNLVNIDPSTDSVAGIAGDGGSAMTFGATSYFDFTQQDIVGDLSFSGWINPTTDLAFTLWGDDNGSAAWIRFINGNEIHFRAGSVNTVIAHNLGFVTGEAQHFAVVREAGTVTVYRNGVASGVTGSNSNSFRLNSFGRFSGGLNFEGVADDLLTFDYTLSAAEVAAIYAGPRRTNLLLTPKNPASLFSTPRNVDAIDGMGMVRASGELRLGKSCAVAADMPVPTIAKDLSTLSAGGNWRVLGSSSQADGETPLVVMYNSSTLNISVLGGTDYATIDTRSISKSGAADFLLGQADEVANYRHTPVTIQGSDGLLVAKFQVSVDPGGGYAVAHIAMGFSVDNGVTWTLIDQHGTSDPYITPDNFSAGRTYLGPWSVTIEPIVVNGEVTRCVVHVADYENNPGSSGGEFWRCDFTRSTASSSDWSPVGLKKIYSYTRAEGHAHSAYGNLLIIGDTAANETRSYQVDGGYNNYLTGTITTEVLEPLARASQPVDGARDAEGNPIFACDNAPYIVQRWNADRQLFEGVSYVGPNDQPGGNEGLFLQSYNQGRSTPHYLAGLSPSSALNDDAKRYYYSQDGKQWVPVIVPRVFLASANDLPALYGDKIIYVDGSDLLAVSVPAIIEQQPVQSSPGGTFINPGWIKDDFGDSVGVACPVVDGLQRWPDGYGHDGEAIQPQFPTDWPVFYWQPKSTDDATDEGYFRANATQVAGTYFSKFRVLHTMRDGVRFQFRHAIGASTPFIVTSGNAPGQFREYIGVNKQAVTSQPQINFGISEPTFFQPTHISSTLNYDVPADASSIPSDVVSWTIGSEKTISFNVRVPEPHDSVLWALGDVTDVLLATVNSGANDRIELHYDQFDGTTAGRLLLEIYRGGSLSTSTTIADVFLLTADLVRLTLSSDDTTLRTQVDYTDRRATLDSAGAFALSDVTGGDQPLEYLLTASNDLAATDLAGVLVGDAPPIPASLSSRIFRPQNFARR